MSSSFSNAAQLLEELHSHDIQVEIDGDRLRFYGPQGTLTESVRQQLADHKMELLAYLQQEQSQQVGARKITALPRPGVFPASFAQQRLWFIDQLEPNSSLYNIPIVYRLRGALNINALEQSLHEILHRHESLRTNLVKREERPWQLIREGRDLDMPVVDLSHLAPADREDAALKLAVDEGNTPFDLEHDLMLRAKLFHLHDTAHLLAITMHHVASDGWSTVNFWRELKALYEAFAAGMPSPLPPLNIQYADYAVWQRGWLQGHVLQRQLAYWRRQLAGLQPLVLPTDHQRPLNTSNQGAVERFELPDALAAQLQKAATEESATLFMLLLTAFYVLLYRYSGQDDIVVGTPIANRDLRDVEELIGFFVNTLVIRADLAGNPSFRDLLQRVRRTLLEAYDHQDLPFEKLVEELQPQRDLSRQPLFEVMFALQIRSARSRAMAGLEVKRLRPAGRGLSKFDLNLTMSLTAGSLAGSISYRSDLFEAATIRRMIGHYQTLLEAIAEDSYQAIGQLPLLTEREQKQLLVAWNDTATPYPGSSTIDQLFESQAQSTPQAPAIYFEGQTLTYAQLDSQANQLAHLLLAAGVRPGEIVGLALQRSLELVMAVLAILKSGAAYLPLDAANPPERTNWMLNEAQCRFVITQNGCQLSGPGAWRILNLDGVEVAAALRRQPAERPRRPDAGSSLQLAYVMYTSGSSGRPKGVMIPHRAVVRLVKNSNYIDFQPSQRFLQFAPIGFDASTLEIWGPLLNGGQLFVYPPGPAALAELAQYLREQKITTLWLTASLFHQMVENEVETLAGVDHVLAGGDIVSAQHVRRLLETGGNCRFSNGYGPTENTTFTTTFTVTEPGQIGDRLPIGRPVSNSMVYILDTSLQPVPIGVTGELFAGGDGLALGYLNRPDLAEQAFIPDPFSAGRQARLYRTGDRARYRPDGNIEFLGRIDRQVKIRGFRVEPGEIESVLMQNPAVQEAVVVAREDQPGDKRLIAYCTPRDHASAFDAAQLRAFCTEKLPDYMVPASIVSLDQFPLTPHGKVDKAALPAPSAVEPIEGSHYTPPQNQVEKLLCALWAEVLELDKVGIDDNFFELGGHSLLAIKLFARIEDQFDQHLPLSLLFRAPTVGGLASHLRQPDVTGSSSVLVPIQEGGQRPPFFCVHGFGGGVIDYADLARLMGPDQPFYGLQAFGLAPGEDADTSIDSMASRYVAAMREVQPSGPYLIGGYCLGGVVAFEMARQLEAAGEAVPVVAIMEGYAPARFQHRASIVSLRRWRTVWQNIPYWLEDYWSLGFAGVRLRITRRVQFWTKKLQRLLGKDVIFNAQDAMPDDLSLLPDQHRQLFETHLIALKNYAPEPVHGPLTLFVARGLTINQALLGSADPEHGWGALTQEGVEIVTVDGGHRNIHLPPHVASLAAALDKKLRSTDPINNGETTRRSP